jgi:hypothetical protein
MVWAVALSAMNLIAHCLIAVILRSDGIRSLIGFGSLVGPLSHSVLYLRRSTSTTLALKRFRREPAITGFD